MTLADRAHFGDYWPPDFGWAQRDPFQDSSLLVDFTHSGAHFGSMHKDVVGLFTAFLDELVPHISGGLRDGKCGCYNPNSLLSDGVTRSFHTWGIAIDLNWSWNAMGTDVDTPDAGDLYEIPQGIADDLALKYGLEYGGNWIDFKDYMHFEVHLSPADARTVEADMPLTDADAKTIWDHVLVDAEGTKVPAAGRLKKAERQATLANARATSLETQVKALQAAVAKIETGGVAGTLHLSGDVTVAPK